MWGLHRKQCPLTPCPVAVLQGELELPLPQPVPGHSVRRHVRTIREVRTIVTRTITDVYYEDGREVDRTVTEVSAPLPSISFHPLLRFYTL